MSAGKYDFANMTQAQVLDALVDLDVSKWGESERDASRRLHAGKSLGLLINSIVHHERNEYGDVFGATTKKLASKLLTSADMATLRGGG